METDLLSTVHVSDWVSCSEESDIDAFTWRTKESLNHPDPFTIGTLVLQFEHKRTIYRPVFYADFQKLRQYIEREEYDGFEDGLAKLSEQATSVRTITDDS